jgi:phosphoribosylformylglycinamidine synthase subunit PurL
VLAGIGHYAGVVDIGQGYAVTFKIESHNHPSYVEPHQGAATGVGGIVRDILAMGARPVAVMDALRFGPAEAPDTGRVLPGVVSGISFYGNCLGLPNIGGELDFDPCYAGNPLVNVLCVGVMRHGDMQVATATGPVPGEAASGVLPRAVRGGSGGGHPEPRRGRRGLHDHRTRGGGHRRHADRAGRGATARPSLGPPEILISESQERMMAVVESAMVAAFLDVCAKGGSRGEQ